MHNRSLLVALLGLTLAAGDPRLVMFSWAKVPGATGYQLQVAREPSFAAPVLDETVQTTRYNWRTPDAADYYWRVRALEPGGRAGAWSRVEVNHDRPPPPPEPPALLQPKDGARITIAADSAAIDLVFTAGTPVAPLTLEVAHDAGFAQLVHTTRGSDTRVRVQLPDTGTYHWRVRREAAGAAPAVSSPARRLLVVLGAPAELAPADGALGGAETTLRWRSVRAAVSWQVELSSEGVAVHDTPTPSFSLASLAPGVYRWRVRAVDRRGQAGPWSPPRSLRRWPASLVLLAPADGAVLPPAEKVRFAWEPVPSASGYELELAGDAAFTAPTRHAVAEPTLELPLGAGEHHWRVTALSSTDPAAAPRLSSAAARLTLTLSKPAVVEPLPLVPLPAAPADTVWLSASLGLHGDLGALWAALVRLEAAWRPGLIDPRLAIVARLGYFQNDSAYRVPGTPIRLRQRALVVPVGLAAAWRASLPPLELVAGAGPAVQLAFLEVGREATWSARPGGEAFVNAGYPLGPGVVTLELGLFVHANLATLLSLPVGGTLLTAGYRVHL